MSTTNPSQPEKSSVSPDVRAIIAQTSPEDYDGHTEFSRMTPAQRLAWLDQAVLFIAAQKDANTSWKVAEEPANKYKLE
ncbi:MAG: hypothetical protein IPP19_11050 [Verrucomicrobia bacterium]|nr:hypothetical protein [Verrucomicrobiota bacterium]